MNIGSIGAKPVARKPQGSGGEADGTIRQLKQQIGELDKKIKELENKIGKGGSPKDIEQLQKKLNEAIQKKQDLERQISELQKQTEQQKASDTKPTGAEETDLPSRRRFDEYVEGGEGQQ